MRLALVISSLIMGGAEGVLAHLASMWANLGVDVHLITLASQDTDFYTLPVLVNRISLNLMKDSANLMQALGNNLSRVKALRKQFKCVKPHAVVSFMDATNVLVIFAATGLGIPTIISERTDPGKYRPQLGTIWDNLRKVTYPRAKAVVAVSQATSQQLSARMPRTLVEVIPNPVFHYEPNRLTASQHQPPTVVSMGRLVSLKKFDLLIKAFANCMAVHPEWRLLILGDGPQRGDLESLIDELDLGKNIHLLGAVKEPAPILAQADIFALYSSFEGFSNSLVEAMACKLPVICSHEAGEEIVTDNEQGLLVPEDDVDALTNSLQLLMGDRAMRERMGKAAQLSVRKYLFPNVINQWSQLFSRTTGMEWPTMK